MNRLLHSVAVGYDTGKSVSSGFVAELGACRTVETLVAKPLHRPYMLSPVVCLLKVVVCKAAG